MTSRAECRFPARGGWISASPPGGERVCRPGYNSNHAVAAWLDDLGVEVRGWPVYARWDAPADGCDWRRQPEVSPGTRPQRPCRFAGSGCSRLRHGGPHVYRGKSPSTSNPAGKSEDARRERLSGAYYVRRVRGRQHQLRQSELPKVFPGGRPPSTLKKSGSAEPSYRGVGVDPITKDSSRARAGPLTGSVDGLQEVDQELVGGFRALLLDPVTGAVEDLRTGEARKRLGKALDGRRAPDGGAVL